VIPPGRTDITLESQLIQECGSILRYEDMIYLAVPVDFIQSDFPYYDWILVMDDRNYQDVMGLDSSREYASKIRRMTDFCQLMKVNEVPDPYYGGDAGFELVIDILEDACAGLMERLKAE